MDDHEEEEETRDREDREEDHPDLYEREKCDNGRDEKWQKEEK